MTKSRLANGQLFAHARVIAAVVALLLGSAPAHGAFHAVVIDEMLTSHNGDANVQFVEMRTLAGLQVVVSNSVFAAFDASGNYVDDILVVPGPNLGNAASGVRWLIGTAEFQQQSGLAPDFVMPSGILPTEGGMICFGGGGGLFPLNPPNWDRTSINNYVDCIAYGNYSGPTNVRIGNPTPLDANGHSLQRTGNTHDNLTDFACVDTATPQNNAGTTVDLAASASCSGAETPTETPTVLEATPTQTPTATATPGTPTPTATPGPPIACVADCDENGSVSMPEVIRAVGIALTTVPLEMCEQADANDDGFPTIDELVRAVASSVRGCI